MKSNQITLENILSYCGFVGKNRLRISYLKSQIGNDLPHVFFLLNLPFVGFSLFRILEPLLRKLNPKVEEILRVAVSMSHSDKSSIINFYRLNSPKKAFVFLGFAYTCFFVFLELTSVLICFFVKRNGKKN